MMTRKFGRTKAHREHLLANMGRLLVRSEKLETTLPKAKEVRSIVERWLTLAKRISSGEGAEALADRRHLYSIVGDIDVATKLINDLAKRASVRDGGYTRILKIGYRVGDAAPKARILFVDQPVKDEKAGKAVQKAKSAVKTAGKVAE